MERTQDYEQLIVAIEAAWTKETSASPEEWSPENRALGQCAVTAAVLQDYAGGRIVNAVAEMPDGSKKSHYFNIIAGDEIDLTRSQFPEGTQVPEGSEKRQGYETTREYLMSSDKTRPRYEELSARVEKFMTNPEKLLNRQLTNLIDQTMNRFSENITRDHGYEEDRYLELIAEGTNSIFVMDYDDERAGRVILYLNQAKGSEEVEYEYSIIAGKPRVIRTRHGYSSSSDVEATKEIEALAVSPLGQGHIDALAKQLEAARPHPNPQYPVI